MKSFEGSKVQWHICCLFDVCLPGITISKNLQFSLHICPVAYIKPNC